MRPPPAKVLFEAELSVNRIVDVFVLKVSPVVVAKLHVVPAVVQDQVPEPIVTVRVFALEEAMSENVTLNPLALKTPLLIVKVPVLPEFAKLSCSVRVPPTISILKA